MSNFKRTRSKVWWDDSPAHIGSPVAQPSNWNKNNQHDDKDWEPQVPQWIGSNPDPPTVTVNNGQVMSPKEAPANPWPLRHGSPGSHKSQDSGFSDSDSSPPTSQYYPSPEIDNSKSANKSSSSSDSNNNENVTVKQVIDFKDTPKSTKHLEVPNPMTTPKTLSNKMRSTSVIQTPYDFQKYIEVHGDEEHLERLKDSTENITAKTSENEAVNTATRPKIVNNNRNYDKMSTKPLVSKNKESCVTKEIKIAKVKDLETSKTKSQDSLEYLQVSDTDRVAVNNQPRIRSPISSIPFVPPPDYDLDNSPKRPVYSRSTSQQNAIREYEETEFQRNRLNKSLNYEGQRLDRQILDIQEGYHSLSFDEGTNSMKNYQEELEGRSSRFNIKKVTDSLQLKSHKKYGPKHKHKSTPKHKEGTCAFRIFSSKREKPPIVDSHAGGILEGSRVPSLGLPRCIEKDEWVIVGYPEGDKSIHSERLIGNQTEAGLHSKLNETKDLSKSAEIKKIPPPVTFEDRKSELSKSLDHLSDNVNVDSKIDKLKVSTESFCMNFNMESTSTPKMLAPQEFMYNMAMTPQLPGKTSRLRRVNLLENFNENTSQPKNSPEYQERSIDETPLERTTKGRPDSVQYWLCDLIGSCENECMTTLQSKALGLEVKELLSSSSATITGNIKKVQTHGLIIVHQYSEVLYLLEQRSRPASEPLCLLVANVYEFVLAHSITLNTRPPAETPERWDKVRAQLQIYLHKMVEIGEDITTELNDSNADSGVLAKHLDSMLNIFQETVKAVLIQQLKTLVSIIEEPPSDIVLKSTLTSVGHLAAETDGEGKLHDRCRELASSVTLLPFVECGVPRALLTAVIETGKNSVKALSLRALATICVSCEAVEQFEQAGGMEIIADMLSDEKLPEPAVREAATVLAQTTATWRKGSDPASLCKHLDTLIAGLTRILGKTECCQLVLLSAACLVNLIRETEGGAQVDTVAILSRHRTVETLLDAVKRRGPDVSVFLQEQTAAFISTLCDSPRCLRHVMSSRVATLALVCFARASPGDFDTDGDRERGARARLLRHTTRALSRLSMFPEPASQIVQLEGVPRLVRLVRMQRAARLPDSAEVLVHCLGALRNLSRHRPDAFEQQSAEVREMVDGHLVRSLVKFSSDRGSYV